MSVPAQRERLPNRRRGVTQKAVIGGSMKVYASVGRYADGRLAEVFIRLHREGEAFRTLMDTFAVVLSLALQHGVPPLVLADALIGVRFDPRGEVEGDERVQTCTSILDYIGQVIAAEARA